MKPLPVECNQCHKIVLSDMCRHGICRECQDLPAEEDEPLTTEWLSKEGYLSPRLIGGDMEFKLDGEFLRLESHECNCCVGLHHIKTRGQLRVLFTGLTGHPCPMAQAMLPVMLAAVREEMRNPTAPDPGELD